MQAYEHGMAISIVALRGSIPSQYAVDFKTSIGKYCGFSLDQRSQLADIYKVWVQGTRTQQLHTCACRCRAPSGVPLWAAPGTCTSLRRQLEKPFHSVIYHETANA